MTAENTSARDVGRNFPPQDSWHLLRELYDEAGATSERLYEIGEIGAKLQTHGAPYEPTDSPQEPVGATQVAEFIAQGTKNNRAVTIGFTPTAQEAELLAERDVVLSQYEAHRRELWEYFLGAFENASPAEYLGTAAAFGAVNVYVPSYASEALAERAQIRGRILGEALTKNVPVLGRGPTSEDPHNELFGGNLKAFTYKPHELGTLGIELALELDRSATGKSPLELDWDLYRTLDPAQPETLYAGDDLIEFASELKAPASLFAGEVALRDAGLNLSEFLRAS